MKAIPLAKPKKQTRPIKRLTALAHELAADGILPDAGKAAHTALHALLDQARIDFVDAIAKARQSVLTVNGKTARADVHTLEMTFDDFVEDADLAVIEDAYKRASRMISPDLAKTYSEHLAEINNDTADEEEALIDAHTDVAAIGLVPAIKDLLEQDAERLANNWLTDHDATIKSLSDERRDVYRELRALSGNPLDVTLAMPRSSLQATIELKEDGTELPLPRYDNHLLCDENGLFPSDFNTWELEVLAQEAKQHDFVAWYRNPSSANPESLGVTYPDDGQRSILRPDFIFFSKLGEGELKGNHSVKAAYFLVANYADQYPA